MSSAFDLYPCPFCGGATDFDRSPAPGDDLLESWFVFCTKCQLEQPISYSTADQAIDAWNTRKDKDDEIRERVAEAMQRIREDETIFRTLVCEALGFEDGCDTDEAISAIEKLQVKSRELSSSVSGGSR